MMLDNIEQTYSTLYLEDILVHCCPQDANRPEWAGLALVIVSEKNTRLGLTQISMTAWRQKNQNALRVPAASFLLVATSDEFGDLGHIQIDDPVAQIGNDLKWNFDPTESAPTLSLSATVQARPLSEAEYGTAEVEVEDVLELILSILSSESALQLILERQEDLEDVSQKAHVIDMLGYKLLERFRDTQEEVDINASITAFEEVTSLVSDENRQFPKFLHEAAAAYIMRFERLGQIEDLDKAIEMSQRALAVVPDDHELLPFLLNNLGISLTYRFKWTGDLKDISQSIQLQQKAIKLTPRGHPNLPSLLSNLGGAFQHRFERTGDLTDNSQSINLQQRAVEHARDGGGAGLPTRLNNLAAAFLRRFERTCNLTDLSTSIHVQREAIKLTADGHADLPMRLQNLGVLLQNQFQQTEDLTSISQAIQFGQRALDLTPEGHPDLPSRLNNLGNAFYRRFVQTGHIVDILQSTRLQRKAIGLAPEGHAGLSRWLHNLGLSLYKSYKRTLSRPTLILAVSNFRSAALLVTGSPSDCLRAAKCWAKLSPQILPSEVLAAHERIVHLLSLIAGLENTLQRRHEILAETTALSNAAAAAALSANQPSKALEWLEEGRCIVWNQLNQLRAPLDKLREYEPALAERLTNLSRQLEIAGTRADHRYATEELTMDAQISLQTEAHHHLELARERDELLATIRNRAGFADFLRPKKCADLMKAIPEDGTVVIVNATAGRCDALILLSRRDKPIHISLERFSHAAATEHLESLRDDLRWHNLRARYPEDIEAYSRAARLAVKSKPSEGSLQKLLRALWNDLVEPVLSALPTQDGDDLRRIWWCPTGPFAFLPIHAAGIYEPGNCGKRLADFAISSYIPTLTALRRQRSAMKANPNNQGVLLVSQPDTPGLQKIPYTDKEIETVRSELNRRRIGLATYRSKEATIPTISNALESFSCVHLACHASQGKDDPLDSAIHLYDGPLKLSEILKKNLPNADLAFMSACQTSVGHEKLSEEAVHLAAGMLAAGYQSVVATMWSISDEHATDVADVFYKCLLNKESRDGVIALDIRDSAQALHIAVQYLRRRLEKQGDMTMALLAWIPYIHFGI